MSSSFVYAYVLNLFHLRETWRMRKGPRQFLKAEKVRHLQKNIFASFPNNLLRFIPFDGKSLQILAGLNPR